MRTSIVLLAAIAISGCTFTAFPIPSPVATFNGNGTPKIEVRTPGPFTGVDVGGALPVEIATGPEPKITLSGDENILAIIETEVRDGTLSITQATDLNLRPTRPLKIAVVLPALDHLAARGAASVTATTSGEKAEFRVVGAGAGRVTVDGVSAESIVIEAGGASRVGIEGKSKRMTAHLKDASRLDADKMRSDQVKLTMGGASRAEVHPVEAIKATIKDASRLELAAEPKTVEIEKEGAASVGKR